MGDFPTNVLGSALHHYHKNKKNQGNIIWKNGFQFLQHYTSINNIQIVSLAGAWCTAHIVLLSSLVVVLPGIVFSQLQALPTG